MSDGNDPFSCFGDSSSSSDGYGGYCSDAAATSTDTDANLEEARRLKSRANADPPPPIELNFITDDARFEVFDSGPLSGKGIRATIGYKCGEEIMRERAAMRIPNSQAASSPEGARGMHRRAVQRAFGAMHRTTQSACMDLSSCDEEDDGRTPWGVYDTNAYRLDPEDRGGLFLTIARINHSCRPNVNLSWREDLQQSLIFAARDIAAGEELFNTYGPPSCMDAMGRREYLSDRFSFECMCAMCTEGNANGGDERMVRIQSLKEDIAFSSSSMRSGDDATAALGAIDNCLALMNEQGIGGPVFAKSIYHHGYRICMAAKDSEGARSYLERELKAVQDSEGMGCPKAIEIERVLNLNAAIKV